MTSAPIHDESREKARTNSKRTGELDCIGYLRGLAALGVVLFHVRIYLWVGLQTLRANPALGDPFARAMAWLSVPTPFLGSGVMLFFVISGFCIHFPYASPQGRPFLAGEYAIRRFFRIYPPYLVAVLLSLGVEWLSVVLGALPRVDWHLNLLSAFLLQNWIGQQPVCDPAFWTLPIEVEFYFLFPLIYWGLKSFPLAWTVAASGAVTLAATALFAANFPLMEDHFALYWLMWVAGAALAELYQSNRLSTPPWWVIGLGLLCAALAITATTGAISGRTGRIWELLHAGVHFEFGMCFVVVVWWSICHQDWYARFPLFLASSLALLGQVSYSLYLIHMPLFYLCGDLWVRHFGQKPVNFLVSLPFCLLAVGAAAILYRLVEAPSHFLGRTLARRLTSTRRGKP